jgi:hypothetical protein
LPEAIDDRIRFAGHGLERYPRRAGHATQCSMVGGEPISAPTPSTHHPDVALMENGSLLA